MVPIIKKISSKCSLDIHFAPIRGFVFLTQLVLRNFFSNFGLIFQFVSPPRPLDMRFKRKKKFSVPEVCFLDATRFVRLVLTGVRVTNFLNIANLDIIFLHNTQILAVLLSVGLFSFLICLSCLSV
jgi:hypothetical protein